MKKNTKLKYLPIAAFAAVAVALAGCGGGGGSSPVTSDTDPMAPMAPTVALADLPGTTVAPGTIITVTPEELAAIVLAVADIDVPDDGYPPGDMVTIPGIGVLTCTGDDNCSVEVAADGTITTVGTIEVAGTMMGGDPTTPVDPTGPTPMELADTAYGEYETARTAFDIARDTYNLNDTAANLAALKAAAVLAEMEANEALVLAADGSAAQLIRARAAVNAAEMASLDVADIEMDVADAAALVKALDGAALAAIAYNGAKTAYEEDMTQATLDDLTAAATAAKEAADAALKLAEVGSAAELLAAQAAVTAATEASDAVDGIVTALQTGIGDALTAYTTAKAAHVAAGIAHTGDPSLDNANALKKAADDLQAAAMAARVASELGASDAQAAELADVISVDDAATAVADATSKVTAAQTFADDAAEKDTTADSIALAEAINAEAPATLTGPFDSDTLEENYTVMVSRARGEYAKVTVTDLMEATDDDDEKLTVSTEDMPAELEGWMGSIHTRSGDDSSESVTVYTDINLPADAAYETYYSVSNRLGVTDAASTQDGDTLGQLTLDTDDADVAAAGKAGLYSAANFPETGDQIKTYIDDDATDADERMFAGMFNGVPGMYACSDATGCGATSDKDGLLTTLTGTWTFTPTDYAADKYKVLGVTPDPDYLRFGYWVETTPGEDGEANSYAIQAFSSGLLPYDGTEIEDVRGSATYDGSAAGVYVQKSDFDANTGKHGAAVSGDFTADVTLTANFGGPAVAAVDSFSISGEVSIFKDAASGNHIEGWAADLMKTTFGERNDETQLVTGQTNDFNGMTTGGGAWTGMFFGSSEVTADETDPANVTMQPTGVAGEFDAHFSNGHVAGAFGATQ